MNTIDIVLLIALLPFLIQGIRKGFVSQLTALVSTILSIWMAFKFSSLVTAWLRPHLQFSDSLLSVISFVLILLVVVLVLHVVGKIIEQALKLVMLGWLDKLLGFVLSLVKGFLVIGLLIILFNTINTNFHLVTEETLSQSVLYPALKDLAYTVFPFLKEWIFNAKGASDSQTATQAVAQLISIL